MYLANGLIHTIDSTVDERRRITPIDRYLEHFVVRLLQVPGNLWDGVKAG